MVTGLQGSPDVTLTLEDGPGSGNARALHGFIKSGIEMGHEAETTDTTGFGDSFREHSPTGMKTHDDITLVCLFDTTGTTGTHAILGTVDDGPNDDGRELICVVGDSKTYTVDVRLVKYKVVATLDDVQMVNVILRPTGAGVWS